MRNSNKLFILLFIIILTFLCVTTVSADSEYLSKELETIDNGTVSGGLYSDTYYGFDEKHVNINYSDTISNDNTVSSDYSDDSTTTQNPDNQNNESPVEVNFDDRNATYVFKPLPDNAKIRSAHLIVAVYMANINRNYPVPIELTFNGKTYVNETLSSVYINSEGQTIINDNINRVTSDYLMHYDVTDNLKLTGNYVHIDVSKSTTGQIKMATLIVSYDDDDYDLYYYTINYGHDVVNIDDYTGSTKFHGVYSGSRVSDVNLTSYYLASVNAAYKYNRAVLESYPPQAGYGGVCSWNVTRNYRVASDNNVLQYEKIGSYFKIIASTMLVKFTNKNMIPDLTIKDVKINPNDYNYNNSVLLDDTNEIIVDLENTGARDAKIFNVTLNVGNDTYVKTVDSLKSLETTYVKFDVNYTSTLKDVNITVLVDEENIVSEVTKSNNYYTTIVDTRYSKFADLNISDIIFDENILINQQTTIKINITNDGFAKSGNAWMEVYMDDGNSRTLLKTFEINALNINESAIKEIDWIPSNYGMYTISVNLTAVDDFDEVSLDNNQINYTAVVYNPNKLSLFIISDNAGTNSYNQASKSILSDYAGLVEIQIRTDNQALVMSNQELTAFLESSDIVVFDWLSSGIYEKIDKIIKNNPNITRNKANKIFLVLEPPVSTTAASATLIRNSTFIVNRKDRISSISNLSVEKIISYYSNTTRGLLYSDIYKYVNNSTDVPSLYNQATLYKDLSNVDGYRNMMLWLLNSINPWKYNKTYTLPPRSLNEPVYGIYREKWYSYLDNDGKWHDGYNEYAQNFINSTRPTVGIIESKMYVDSQQLQPYYEIINKLELLGINVIPIVAYGGTNEQLEVMYKIFTNASSLDEFINSPSNYENRIDALINMVAYGLGGTDFSKVTPFFTNLNVPILKAVHSDYISNTEYNLGTTGLGALGGDKWWHITISEAQGSVTPTFVGGYSYTIDNDTGASLSGYVAHEGNIEVLANSVYNWVLLKHLSNSDKKIALIYYNYPPGKQNIAASYMDPVESTFNLLNILKDNGYDVKNIPKNSTILLAQMLSQGTNVANWANGLVEVMADFSNSSYDEIYGYQVNNTYKIDLENMTEEEIASLKDTPGVLLYPVSKFKQWYDKLDDINKLTISEGPVAYIGEYTKQAVLLNYTNFTKNIDSWYDGVKELVPAAKLGIVLPLLNNITSTLKMYVQTANESYFNQYLELKEEFLTYNIEGLSGWGEFPGNIMVVEREGIRYFVLPGIQYGNVFIGPEPQRGWEGNAEQLYHNSIVPPHYQYLAFYSYLQEEKYNAMVFMGRHATHEWLSGKEVLCSDTDFTTVITGTIPQVYFYITDGISEGLTTKRRASAVIIDHLTPPMTLTNLYGNLSYLHSLTEEYEVSDKDKRAELATQMREIILAEEYDRDMGVDIDALDDDQLVASINDYVNALTSTLYPYGVHVLGQNWSDEEIALLVTSMLSSEYEYDDSGSTTSLLDEIAMIDEGKKYLELSASKRTTVQNKALEVINNLIIFGKDSVVNNLTDNSTLSLNKTLDLALKYISTLRQSTQNEINSFINALNAGYVEPGMGGDPVNNPGAIDTGKNFYQDQSSEIPTKAAYDKSKDLLNITLSNLDNSTRKIVLGIWDTETARDDGQLVSLVLRLLGMKPTWSSSPSAGADGKKLRETPEYEELEDMYRPDGWNQTRLDVVVVLDGNFRDLYSRQVGLMDKAFRIALARSYNTIINNETLVDKYGDDLFTAINNVMEGIGYYGAASESLESNAVAENWIKDFEYYMSINMTAQQAGEYAISRIFAPPESDYGALISQAVRQSWTFNDSKELATKYINRMGYIYSSTNWGAYNSKVLERLLTGATSLFTSRNTNLYGVIDNDDYFDYWGGLYNAMGYINNDEISFKVIKYGDSINTTLIDIGQYLKREMNTRYYNAQWIKAMMEQDYAGSSYMSRFASNLYGWATVTDKVTNKDWDNMVSVYIDDKYGIGVNKFLTNGYNSYAMISMTGTLLTAAYESKWSTNEETLRKVANIWAQSVIDNGVACCDCSCGNIFMMDWSLKYINADLLSKLKPKLYQATQNKIFYDSGYGETDDLNGSMNGTGNATGNSTGEVGGNSAGDIGGNATGNITGNATGNSTGNSTGGNNQQGYNDGNNTGTNSTVGPVVPIIDDNSTEVVANDTNSSVVNNETTNSTDVNSTDDTVDNSTDIKNETSDNPIHNSTQTNDTSDNSTDVNSTDVPVGPVVDVNGTDVVANGTNSSVVDNVTGNSTDVNPTDNPVSNSTQEENDTAENSTDVPVGPVVDVNGTDVVVNDTNSSVVDNVTDNSTDVNPTDNPVSNSTQDSNDTAANSTDVNSTDVPVNPVVDVNDTNVNHTVDSNDTADNSTDVPTEPVVDVNGTDVVVNDTNSSVVDNVTHNSTDVNPTDNVNHTVDRNDTAENSTDVPTEPVVDVNSTDVVVNNTNTSVVVQNQTNDTSDVQEDNTVNDTSDVQEDNLNNTTEPTDVNTNSTTNKTNEDDYTSSPVGDDVKTDESQTDTNTEQTTKEDTPKEEIPNEDTNKDYTNQKPDSEVVVNPTDSDENSQQSNNEVTSQSANQESSQISNNKPQSASEITIYSKGSSLNQEVSATATLSKAHELETMKKGSAITESAMSALAIIFVLLLLGAVAYGYYNKRDLN